MLGHEISRKCEKGDGGGERREVWICWRSSQFRPLPIILVNTREVDANEDRNIG